MLGSVAWLAVVLVTAPDPALGENSVAVMPLVGKQGVQADLAELLTENVVARVRQSKRFTRVISTTEVADTLNLEQKRQMVDCSSTSCLTEIAAALGTHFLIAGSIGRIGEAWLFNLRLVNAHSGIGESSVSRLIEGASETALVRSVDSLVSELLHEAAAAPSTPPPPTPTTEPTAAPSRSSFALPLRIVGAAGAIIGGAALAVGAMAALAGGAAAVGALVFDVVGPRSGRYYHQLVQGFVAGCIVLVVAAGVGVVGGVIAAAGAGTAGASWVVP